MSEGLHFNSKVERDAWIKSQLIAGVLPGSEIANLVGLTPARIAQLREKFHESDPNVPAGSHSLPRSRERMSRSARRRWSEADRATRDGWLEKSDLEAHSIPARRKMSEKATKRMRRLTP